MVVAMRLMRMGTTHRPLYRISVADSRRAPTGKFIEHIGTYNPHLDKMGNKMLRLNVARAKYWIAMGCQPSTVVARLLSRFNLIPVPPHKQMAVIDPLVLKALAGEDIRGELIAQSETPLRANEVNGVLVHPTSLGNRRQKELTPERIAQLKKQAPWKLQTFPFEYQPTAATQAAWNQARIFHGYADANEAAYEQLVERAREENEADIEADEPDYEVERVEAVIEARIEERLAAARAAGANEAELKKLEKQYEAEAVEEADALLAEDLAAEVVDDLASLDMDEDELIDEEEDEEAVDSEGEEDETRSMKAGEEGFTQEELQAETSSSSSSSQPIDVQAEVISSKPEKQ